MSILKIQIVRFFIAISLSWGVVSLYSQDRGEKRFWQVELSGALIIKVLGRLNLQLPFCP